MDLTTLERVKRLLPGAAESTEEDPLLASLITSASAMAAQFLRREVQTAARTNTYDWACGRRRLFLPAFPVASSPAIDVRFDTEGTFDSTTVVDADSYRLDSENGILHFVYWAPHESVQALRVAWTGGMGTTTETLAAAYPDVVQAVTFQVVHEFRRRKRLDVGSVNIGGQSIAMAGELKLLDHVKALLEPHRRMGFNE